MRKVQITKALKAIVFAFVFLQIYTYSSKFIGMFMHYATETQQNRVVVSLKNTIPLEWILNIAIPTIIYIVIFKLRKIKFFSFCGFKCISKKNFITSIFVGLLISVFILMFINTKYFAPYLYEAIKFFDRFSTGNILYIIIFDIIVFTIFEEMLCRGLIFNELRNAMPLVVAIIIQALPAAIQSDMVLSVFGFASMITYCLTYVCSNSIWGSITVLSTSHIFVMLTRRAGIDKWISSLNDIILITVCFISLILTCLLFVVWVSKSTKMKNINSTVEYYNM